MKKTGPFQEANEDGVGKKKKQGQMHTARRPPGLSNPSAHRTAICMVRAGKICPSTFWGQADLHAQSKQKVIETKKTNSSEARAKRNTSLLVITTHTRH